MEVLVTGATGFVGPNVARLLLADGYRVRVLARPSSSLKAIESCPLEVLRGDILEPASLHSAVKGCRLVFHVATDYRLWAPDLSEIYRANVDGTCNVLEACARAGVERVVYTSSVGTLGVPKDGGSSSPRAGLRQAPPATLSWVSSPWHGANPLGFFLDCARRYGDLVSMRLGVHHVYLVSHPEHVKRVLQGNPRAYSKGPPAARGAALFGDSLTLVDDERWRQRRRQVQPAFLPSQHAHFIAVATRATTEMLDRWRLLADAASLSS